VGRASALLTGRFGGTSPTFRRSVLTRRVAAVALVAAVAIYFALAMRLPDIPGVWWDVAFMAFVLAPAVFALVWLALPYRRSRGLGLVGVACLVLAAGAQVSGFDVVADFAKMAGATAIGFWFLSYFEKVSWVVIVALVIPLVDTISVAGGPTNYIVRERPEIFDVLSFGFPLPGQRTIVLRWDEPVSGTPTAYNVRRTRAGGQLRRLNDEPLPSDARGFVDGGETAHETIAYLVSANYENGSALAAAVARAIGGDDETIAPSYPAPTARSPQNVRTRDEASTFNLGLPDFLFFAVFLAAAARWGLRTKATWAAMVLSLGATMAIALWLDPFGLGGLPALPGIALAFLLPNADLLARSLRRRES
jgi:hypothetical protein